MAEPKSTPKQIAYLEFLGFTNAASYSKAEASEKISELHEQADAGRLDSGIDDLMWEWGYMRFRLYPELYRREMAEYVLYSEDKFRSHVRSRVVGASEKLTMPKVVKVIQALLDEELLWWDRGDSSERFFLKLGEMYPGCVDGVPPSKREQRKALKAMPPIPKNQSIRRFVTSTASPMEKGRAPIKLACLIVFAILVIFSVVSALKDAPEDQRKEPSTQTEKQLKTRDKLTKTNGEGETQSLELKVSTPKETLVDSHPPHTVEIPTAMRTWKSRDGRKVLARVTELDENSETVTFRLADGHEFRDYPIFNFSKEDQLFLFGKEAKARE